MNIKAALDFIRQAYRHANKACARTKLMLRAAVAQLYAKIREANASCQ